MFNACNIPSRMDKPYRVDSSTSSISIGWKPPLEDGGCDITRYAVYMDDGIGGTITNEVNSVNDVFIRDIPTLRSAVITAFPVSTEGNTFRFKVRAFNKEGSVDSLVQSILYAGVPLQPISPPSIITSLTSQSQITVSLP
jgi:hypothetical protein